MTRQMFTDADAKRFGLTKGEQLHRPGHRLTSDVHARDSVTAAYSDYEKELTSAYLSPSGNAEVAGQGSRGPARDPDGVSVEGDSCRTGGGDRGRLVDRGDGTLICVEEPHASDYLSESNETGDAATSAKDHAANMARLYDQLDAELAEKWRS